MALVVMTSGNPDGHRFHFPREIGNAVPLQIAHSAMVAGWPSGRDIEYSGLAVDGLQCQRKCVCTPPLRLTGNLIPYYFIPLQQRMFLILVIRDGQWWLVTGQLSREDDDAR